MMSQSETKRNPLSESQDLRLAKAKELQSTTSLEQFIAKLCVHHQRQIVTALGYLQTEMKALSTTQPSAQKPISSTAKPITITPVKSFDTVKGPCISTPKVELHDISVTLPSVKRKAQFSLRSAVNISSIDADHPSPGCKKPPAAPVDATSVRQSDHVPLKMKIMKTSNVAAGKKLSCVLTTSISSDLENLEDRADHTKSIHSARLSSHPKKQNHSSRLVKITKTFGHCKDVPANPFPPDFPRTARKSIRAAMDQNVKECAQRIIVDPDIGQCDIVYINKPITECFKEPQRHMTPRRNARKSTRGHMYSDDFWVVKTVRTLAGRGNCPNPMPDFITLVTPKQMMSKPESVPPIDMPFVGACMETVVDSGATDNSFDRAIAGSEDVVEVAVSEADIGVETSQTDQQLTTQDPDPQPLGCSPADETENHDKEDVEQNIVVASERETEETVAPVDTDINGRTESKEEGSVDHTVSGDFGDAVIDVSKTPVSSDAVQADDSGLQSNVEQPAQESASEEVTQEEKQETQEEKQPQEYQEPINSEHVPKKTSRSASERSLNEQASPTSDSVSLAHVVKDDKDDVSSKTLEELPPSLPERQVEEVIVGYVNGKPVSASDRSLRHKLPTGPLTSKTEKSNSKKAPTVRAATAQNSINQDVEGKPADTAPAAPQTPAQIPDKPSSAKSKTPANVKQIKRDKRKFSDSASLSDQPESKRQLRSASQKSTVALPSTSKVPTSAKKPSLITPTMIPNTEHMTLKTTSPAKPDDAQVIASPPKPDVEAASTKMDDLVSLPSDCIVSSTPVPPTSPTTPGDPSPLPDLQTTLDRSPPTSTSPENHDNGTISPSQQLSASSKEPDDDIIAPSHQVSASPQMIDNSIIGPSHQSSPEKPDKTQPSPLQPSPISSLTLSSSQSSNEKDKSQTDSAETFKSKRLQAKLRLRSAKVSDPDSPGPKASSPQAPSSSPPRSGADELLSASESHKSTAKDTQKDKERSLEAKQKLRSAKVGEPSGNIETGASPPQPPPTQTSEASESPAGSTSHKSSVQANVEEAQPGVVKSAETQLDPPESSPAKQKLRSARVREDVENLKATTETAGKLESESQRNKCSGKNEAKDLAQTRGPSEASSVEHPASAEDSPETHKPTRMPLRSESSKATTGTTDSPKPSLRSQKHPTSDTSDAAKKLDLASPSRTTPKKTPRVQPRSPTLLVPPVQPPTVGRSRSEHCRKANKFLELLSQEENKQLLTNLNIRFDKMQKGWVQLDKESQPGTKSKYKADRQAAIWKSKRRIRKPKLPEHQKYSAVQMLFMRGFDLPSICRWFLESTETKSLVIVKKVNTRLPSETQLCFHGSSGSSGSSLGVFPSLQAERLKKHLKKFAIASPVKSNPKSQKLIAKVLGLEARGKERRELPSCSHTLTKSRMSAQIPKQKSEPQKASKSKNPTSARILRKYSNIRGKMQVQHTSTRMKDGPKGLKAKKAKTVTATKSDSRSNPKPTVKSQKNPIAKQAKDAPENSEANKTKASKTSTRAPEKTVKVEKTNKSPAKINKTEFPTRCSQRIGSPKTSERSRPERREAEKPELRNKLSATKVPTKQTSTNPETKKSKVVPESSEQSSDVSATPAGDQVLTRSQKKMEAQTVSKKTSNRGAAKPQTLDRKAARPPMTRSGALTTKSRPVTTGPSAATKAKKRALEILASPAKRTRISLSK